MIPANPRCCLPAAKEASSWSAVGGQPVVRPQLLETTATGSAFLAGLGVGLWRSPEELEGVWREDRRFEAQMDSRERKHLYEGWRAAVERVRADRRESSP